MTLQNRRDYFNNFQRKYFHISLMNTNTKQNSSFSVNMGWFSDLLGWGEDEGNFLKFNFGQLIYLFI